MPDWPARGLKRLDSLWPLRARSITDAGVTHLKGLKSLRSLGLWNTQVTPKGLAELLAAAGVGNPLRLPQGGGHRVFGRPAKAGPTLKLVPPYPGLPQQKLLQLDVMVDLPRADLKLSPEVPGSSNWAGSGNQPVRALPERRRVCLAGLASGRLPPTGPSRGRG